ncbi:MAG TPA: hypothetical protein VGG48_05095 [Rhizomicrobium sp.]|jgi:hypothetical protein
MSMPKTEHLSTDTPAMNKEDKLDKQLQDSFPTSDPPSYSGGAIGAPKSRESDAPTPDAHDVVAAEKKVKAGEAKHPDKY